MMLPLDDAGARGRKIAREVTLPRPITIQELSQRHGRRSVDVIKYLMKEAQMMKPGDISSTPTWPNAVLPANSATPSAAETRVRKIR